VKIINVGMDPVRKDGWDAADALAEGWNFEAFEAWIKSRTSQWESGKAEDVKSGSRNQSDIQWPNNPLDLLAKFEPTVLRPELLPDAIVDYVFDQANLMGTDPAIIALATLVSCAGCIHDDFKVQPKRNDPSWTESARLWGAIVGDPSVKKTPGINKVTSPLRKIDMELADEAASKMHNYNLAKKVYDKKEKDFIKMKAIGEAAEPPQKPERPQIDRLLVGDTTVEALSEVLIVCPRGVLVVWDELSSWFGSMDAYKSSGSIGRDRGLWLESYNGGPLRIDRIQRGVMLVPNWGVSILGGIQPAMICTIANKITEDGLLQRFMTVNGRAADIGEDRIPDMKALDCYRNLVKQLYHTEPSSDPIKLSEGAAKVREELSEYVYKLMQTMALPQGLIAHLGKWDGLFARLLLTYHVIEHASQKKFPASFISEATAQTVSKFMREFLLTHALFFYMEVLDSRDRNENLRWIAGYILSKNLDVLTTRDLQRHFKRWRNLQEWERRELLNTLTEAGWLEPNTNSRSELSRMPTRFLVNPKIHELFKEQATTEQKRRAAAREILAEKFGPKIHDQETKVDSEEQGT